METDDDEYDEAIYRQETLADLDALVEEARAGVTRLAIYRLVVKFRRDMRKDLGMKDA
jgi:hypothetical protein